MRLENQAFNLPENTNVGEVCYDSFVSAKYHQILALLDPETAESHISWLSSNKDYFVDQANHLQLLLAKDLTTFKQEKTPSFEEDFSCEWSFSEETGFWEVSVHDETMRISLKTNLEPVLDNDGNEVLELQTFDLKWSLFANRNFRVDLINPYSVYASEKVRFLAGSNRVIDIHPVMTDAEFVQETFVVGHSAQTSESIFNDNEQIILKNFFQTEGEVFYEEGVIAKHKTLQDKTGIKIKTSQMITNAAVTCISQEGSISSMYIYNQDKPIEQPLMSIESSKIDTMRQALRAFEDTLEATPHILVQRTPTLTFCLDDLAFAGRVDEFTFDENILPQKLFKLDEMDIYLGLYNLRGEYLVEVDISGITSFEENKLLVAYCLTDNDQLIICDTRFI